MKKNREKGICFYNAAYTKSITGKGEYFQPPEKCCYYGLWDKALSFIPKTARIFDLGCGPGQFEKLAFDRGYNVVRAIDFSGVAINNAKSINPLHAEVFSIGNLLTQAQYLHDDYDVATMFEVLEHLNNDAYILQNIRKGKKVVFSVPSYMCLGHVRCFPKSEDVVNRYRPFLTNIVIEKIPVDNSVVWLVSAEKA